jgi:hypothetical protein
MPSRLQLSEVQPGAEWGGQRLNAEHGPPAVITAQALHRLRQDLRSFRKEGVALPR